MNGNLQTIEKLFQQSDMCRAKVELMKMLADLSDDALGYVWRPITYAYYYTDFHNQDILSEDDVKRLGLIGAAAHASPETIKVMDLFRLGLLHTEQKKRR